MSIHNPTQSELESAIEEAENIPEELAGAPIATFFNGDKIKLHSLAEYLIEKMYVKTIGGIRREIFIYKDGLYVGGEDILKKHIRRLLGSKCKNNHMREIIELVKDLTTTDRDSFVVDKKFINLNNGIFDIETNRLKPHEPEYLFLTKIPIDYDPEAKCPVIEKYLSEVLDEFQIKIIQEWLGYILYREYFIKKAIIFVGDGDTGKTTFINLIYSFLGALNVASISLQSIASDKFAVANLYNKHVNLYDDLSVKDIKDNGSFKIATGGGLVSGEKKFCDPFVFKNFAKLTFACNKIPDVKDATDDAYFNRWIIISFTRVIEEENKDRQLIHKMTTPEELSGLLNFALEGLSRLLKNQSFSYDKNAQEIKTEMMRSASSIARFVGDCLEEASEEWVSKDEMYNSYTKYTSTNKIPSVSIKTFGGRLPMCAPYLADFKPKDPNDPKGKKQITAWRNVRLKILKSDYTEEESESIESEIPF